MRGRILALHADDWSDQKIADQFNAEHFRQVREARGVPA